MLERRVGFDLPEHFDAVDLRHFQVEEHDGGMPVATCRKAVAAIEVVQRVRAVADQHDFVAEPVLAQRGERQLGVVGVVLGEQDFPNIGHHVLSPLTGSEK